MKQKEHDFLQYYQAFNAVMKCYLLDSKLCMYHQWPACACGKLSHLTVWVVRIWRMGVSRNLYYLAIADACGDLRYCHEVNSLWGRWWGGQLSGVSGGKGVEI